MDERNAGLEQPVPWQGLLGTLNFSRGKPDPRFQRQLDDAFDFLRRQGADEPWKVLGEQLAARLHSLQASGAAGFQDVTQAEAVLALTFKEVLPAYRRHHADLLFHQSDRDLFQSFFLARVFEAILAQGGPWDETERIAVGTLERLNDFVGYRPVAILESRPRGEPYAHERVRPIPWFLRGAGVALGRYHDIIARALELLSGTEPGLLADAGFDPALLDELAVDPRAYDHGHPVNRRPNYVFGEWDPHHLDNQGRYRRFVVRQVTLDALLDRTLHPGERDPAELLHEASAVLAGTILMAAGVTGPSPTAYDSSASLSTLMPRIARTRDAFYDRLLGRMAGPHGERLRDEARRARQPFGGARQHLNQYLAQHRAAQLQQRHLALVYTGMGYPEAGRAEAVRIPTTSVRLLSAIHAHLVTGQTLAERPSEGNALPEAARLLAEVEDLLRRGIDCGALSDPWNILGFQALFPLSAAREDSIRDPRIDELVAIVAQVLGLYALLLSEAAAAGQRELVKSLKSAMRRFAGWWDRFASAEVSDVARVHGGEAGDSAEEVATALGRWHERGEAQADLAFWRKHVGDFRSPKAFALVVETLFRKEDYRAALALLVNWAGQAEQVPLEEGEHSFHALALRWMLAWTGRSAAQAEETWALVRKFFDYLEANAEEYWEVPELEVGAADEDAGQEKGGLYSAAYEDVVYHDSTGDDDEGMVADGGLAEEFDLEVEAERLGVRLHFQDTVARLWQVAARAAAGLADAEPAESLRGWLTRARYNEHRLLTLLDAVHAYPVPEPLGSSDSLVEYNRRRLLKEQLLERTIGTCLVTTMAVGALRGALEPGADEPPLPDRPPWEAPAIELERALLRGDPAAVGHALPGFVERFREEPLVYRSLADGGEPRQVLRVRLAQMVLRALATSVPRLGLLRETCELLRTARAMEQQRPVAGGRGVTDFNHLFPAAFQAAIEHVISSSADWPPGESGDAEVVVLLERLATPFLTLWIDHSQSVQLSVLELLREEPAWEALRAFVQRYGGDLFHPRFLTPANLSGLVYRGAGAYLDYLSENPDPLHPVGLVEDLGRKITREEAVRWLQLIAQAVLENYEAYKDYKATAPQSDYGENLHVLLDFLRLQADYDRHAWQFRPLAVIHEMLAKHGRTEAALLWAENFAQFSRELAEEHLKELAELEQDLGLRLRTVADHLRERFVQPLELDRWCALIEPAMREARLPGPQPTFDHLREELQEQASQPTGAGLDVPGWLQRLEQEVRRVRAARSEVAVLAEGLFRMPKRAVTLEELQRQLDEWETPG